MLKAVSIDEQKYGFLLKFIDEYKDDNGKENASAAIRFLMLKGYEAVNGKAENVNYEPKPKQINYKQMREKLKNELRAELIEEMNNGLVTVIDKLGKSDNSNSILEKLLENQLKGQEALQKQLEALNNKQPVVITKEIIKEVSSTGKVESPEDSEPKSQVKKKKFKNVEGNELLANILGNANR